MNCPTKTIIFSYISIVHLVACVVYLVATINLGTPFKDSLTTEQLEIKKESSTKRLRIYNVGVIIGILTVYLFVE